MRQFQSFLIAEWPRAKCCVEMRERERDAEECATMKPFDLLSVAICIISQDG